MPDGNDRSGLRAGAVLLSLVLALVLGYAVGRATGPDSGPAAATVPAHSHAAPGADVGGLAVSAGGYTLVADSTRFRAGVAAPFTFRVLGPDGKPLTAYVTAYDKPLHLVVVRRDLTGYQHLGVRLQRGRTAAGRRGLRQPGARGRGDGAVEPVRGDEQPAPVPLQARPGGDRVARARTGPAAAAPRRDIGSVPGDRLSTGPPTGV